MEFNGGKKARQCVILVVDEDGENLDAFRANFRDKYQLITAGSVEEAVSVLVSREVAVTIVEYSMENKKGLELLAEAGRIQPGVVGVLMSEKRDADFLVDVVNSNNVRKFVPKPWNAEEVGDILGEALEIYSKSLTAKNRIESLRETLAYYDKEATQSAGFDFIIGRDGDLAGIMDKIRNVAPSSKPVLLQGERGTGKEMLARMLHNLSDRAGGPFVKMNAMELPDKSVEEELFGKSGDASRTVKGRAELADGGTLFIENVDFLSPGAQFRLEELLKTGEFDRIDGALQIKVNVRLVASTAAGLDAMAAAREFRKDLLDLISAYLIEVPPLRERPRDIVALAKFFANRTAKNMGFGSVLFDEAALERMSNHDWPGNLPELMSVIELAVLHSHKGVVRGGDIHPLIRTPTGAESVPLSKERKEAAIDDGSLKNRLADIEREEIVEAIKKAGGKKALAARLLGINRSTLYYRMKKFGLMD